MNQNNPQETTPMNQNHSNLSHAQMLEHLKELIVGGVLQPKPADKETNYQQFLLPLDAEYVTDDRKEFPKSPCGFISDFEGLKLDKPLPLKAFKKNFKNPLPILRAAKSNECKILVAAELLSPLEFLGKWLQLQSKNTDTAKAAIALAQVLDAVDQDAFRKLIRDHTKVSIKALEEQSKAIAKQNNLDDGDDKKALADKFLDLTLQNIEGLFHTPDDRPFVDYIHNGIFHSNHIQASRFKSWLDYLCYTELGKIPSNDVFQSIKAVLAAKAIYENPIIEVTLRTAQTQYAQYLDLCDPQHNIIEIDLAGWRIAQNPPVRFDRPSSAKALPMPIKTDSWDPLYEFRSMLNITDEGWILILSFIIYAYRTGGAFPILSIVGPGGSAKTTCVEQIQALIDPSIAGIVHLPKNEQRIAIKCLKKKLPVFDNMSHITPEQSDHLCRVSTNFGFSTRELFTTMDESYVEFTRPVILTGIDSVVLRGDLASRSIEVQTKKISKSDRQRKEDLDEKFDAIRPKVLGAILDLLVKVRGKLPEITLDELPRMADFAVYGVAVEQVLELEKGSFIKAYNHSQDNAQENVVVSNPIANLIDVFTQTPGFETDKAAPKTWEGTSAKLYDLLHGLVSKNGFTPKYFPQSASRLMRKINSIKPSLESQGIHITDKKTKKGKSITIIDKRVDDSTNENEDDQSPSGDSDQKNTLSPPQDETSILPSLPSPNSSNLDTVGNKAVTAEKNPAVTLPSPESLPSPLKTGSKQAKVLSQQGVEGADARVTAEKTVGDGRNQKVTAENKGDGRVTAEKNPAVTAETIDIKGIEGKGDGSDGRITKSSEPLKEDKKTEDKTEVNGDCPPLIENENSNSEVDGAQVTPIETLKQMRIHPILSKLDSQDQLVYAKSSEELLMLEKVYRNAKKKNNNIKPEDEKEILDDIKGCKNKLNRLWEKAHKIDLAA